MYKRQHAGSAEYPFYTGTNKCCRHSTRSSSVGKSPAVGIDKREVFCTIPVNVAYDKETNMERKFHEAYENQS